MKIKIKKAGFKENGFIIGGYKTARAISALLLIITAAAILSSAAFADLYLNSQTGNIYLNTTNLARMQIAPGGNLILLGQANVSFPANLTVDSGTLFVDSVNNRVGIGTLAPINALTIIGDVSAFGSLNATFINATEIRQGLNQVQTINAVYNLGNYSAEYALTGFKIANYSDAYAASGFKRANITEFLGIDNASLIRIGNFTDLFIKNYSNEYARSGFKIANYSAEYAASGYKTANYSAEYAATGFDRENATDYIGGDNASLLRAINISKDLAKFFSNFNLGNVSNDTLRISNNETISLWNKSGNNIFNREFGGNVGIGTITPDNLLTILGNEITANAILHFNASDNYNNSIVNVMTLDHVLKSGVNSTGRAGVSILFRASDNASQIYNIGNITAVLYNSTNGSQLGAITFSTSGADTGDNSFGHLTEKMRIDGYGRVGIGTAAPNAKLTVIGGANISGGLNVTNGDVLLAVTGGNVGIGTSTPNPNAKLEVNGTIALGGTTTIGGNLNIPSNNLNVGGGYSTGGVSLIGTGADKGSGQFAKDIMIDGAIVAVYDVEINKSFIPIKDLYSILGNITNRFLDLFVVNIKAGNVTLNVTGNVSIGQNTLFVDNTSGRVGIGTASPAGLFDVNSKLIVLSGGNVGIGQTSPNVTLGVSGGANITGTLTVVKGANITGGLRVSELVSCDTINTDATGNLFCGVDAGGSGDIRNSTSWNKTGTNVLLANQEDKVGIGTITPDNLLTVLGNEITANAILHLNASDNYNNSAVNVLTLDHILKSPVNSTGRAGVSILFRASDNASQIYNIGNISAVLYNATNGSQLGALTFSTSGADTGDNSFGHLTERLRIDGYGRVGINTTKPTRALHVVGDANITGRLDVGSLNITGVSFSQGDLDAAGSLRVAGGANISGDLGVLGNIYGEIPNAFKIANYSDAYAATGFKRENATDYIGGDNASLLRTINISKDLAKFFSNFNLGNVSNDTLRISNNETTALWNKSGNNIFNREFGGNVGIGAITPGYKLTVVGNANISGARFISNSFINFTNNTAFNETLYVVDGNVGIGTTSPGELLELETANPLLRFNDTDNPNWWQVGAVGDDFKIYLNDTSADGITINEDGNVGIGTTAPETKLDVTGYILSGTIASGVDDKGFMIAPHDDGVFLDAKPKLGKNLNFRIGEGTGESGAQRTWMSVDATGGNVGIGTTGPGEELEIKSATPELRFNDSDNSNFFDIGMSGTDFKIFSNDTSASGLLIDQSGNVGIGTTNPAQTLTVQGRVNISQNLTVNNSVLFVDGTSGNVGIGTTSPSSLLQVSGTANITSSSTQFLVNTNGDVVINLKG